MNFMVAFRRSSLTTLLLCGALSPSLFSQAPAVATGDTRSVVEPAFPSTCQALMASFHDVSEDVPASVEAASTKLDQSRLQTALNACQGTNQAVELSMDASGNNAFLTGPITIPTGVTLLVDPGVTLYFSRNAQDYDTTPGTHTCGTVNNNSNTASCQNLISITNANNSGIMGFGKLNGRGGDVVLNSFPTAGFEGSTTGKTWWDLATDADSLGASQQNPRGLQISKSTNITLYKITFKNSPNFHVALNTVTGFTAWDMKIVTPYNARNTDGIDPGNTTNATITNSWISDGDDNVAVGAPNSASSNISVINNHFFAGHGESIGSFTTGGVNNVLYDNNLMYGDAEVDGSNSTGIRIKSANDRGNVVQNIQYSNSCFADHGTQIQFTPLYNTNPGTLTPNFKNILLQNLRFSNQGPTATGSFTFLGASNNGTINPLIVTLDNVTVDTVAASNIVAPSNAQITFGPGQVSSNFVSLLNAYNGTNGNVIIDNRTAPALVAPACNFTFLAPELTGPQGSSQNVTAGQFPTAVVILTPAFASNSYPYPSGTVTLTDEASRTFTASLPGTGDTVFIPITNAPTGTHTYTASFSGSAPYAAIPTFGSYAVTVGAGNLSSTTTSLSGVVSPTTFGAGFTATATVSGSSNPSGSVGFLINGAVYATVPLVGGVASFTFNLPTGAYSLGAVYNGDTSNAGSFSAASPVTISPAQTLTTLTSSTTTTTVGTPVSLTATVSSVAGTPTGSVSFSYTTASNSTPTLVGSGALTNGTAVFSALLPQGIDSVSASYVASANFAASTSSPAITITVNAAPIIPLSAAPVAMPYTITTIVGGATSSSANTTCTGSLDSFGNGCQATAIMITGGTSADLRSAAVDPFGNVYFTDANASQIRKVSTSGIVTNFAGYVSGTACVPTTTVGCTPTLVKLNKARGDYADPLGNIYIGGYNDNKVQVVHVADGKMYLIAGTGSSNFSGDGGAASSATLKGPRGVWTDPAGNIYIADSGNNRIREVLNPASGLAGAGNIQTIAGSGATSSTGDNGLATLATLNNPQGVLVDSSSNVYIAESSKVRVVCVACTPGSNLYNLLNKVGVASPVNGDIYTLAGTSTSSNSSLAPGLSTAVNMGPQKLAMDADGNLYIADSSNNVVWFLEGRTGYTHVVAGGGTGTSCAASPIGDSCVGTQAIVGSNGGNGMGVALDQQGNLYISDSTNIRIRKVSNNLRFAASAVGTPAAHTVQLHFIPSDAPSAIALSSPDFTLSAGACTTNSDTTQDCIYTASFTPAVAGSRAAPLTINTSLNNPAYLGLTGTGVGAGATLDPARQLTFGQNLTVNALATDNAGNVYVADAISRSVLKFAPGAAAAGASAPFSTLGSFTNPSALAVDSAGNVFVADATTGEITQLPPSGTPKTLPIAFTSPQSLAVDSLNNLYVSDATAKTITEIGSNQIASRVIANTGLAKPTGVAVDTNANIFVADPTASAVYRFDAQSLARTTASSAVAAPTAVAVDAAGNLLLTDSSTTNIIAVPASPSSAPFTVAPVASVSALALDSIGNLYAASPANQILALERTQALTAFTSTSAPPITVNLLSTGNAAASLALKDPDQTNFALTQTATTDCAIASPISIAAGGACQFNSQFTPASFLNFTNTATFSGNAANANLATPAALQIVQTGNNAPIPGTVQLITTATLSKLGGSGYQAVVTITNNGTGTAQNVKLTAATLGSATGTPLPLSLGNIPPAGGSAITVVSFSSAAGADGAPAAERYSGTYTGGSFGGSIRATLP
ncbi:Ig-like domain-containing protein [Edaphobacter aggregans]|uniref:Ig-like domain-containing protein n=1 Tax=Edaphobacter aggregans TaxID=570835 RepID=A0A3R9QK88_9BACT|nr:glycosyl hydrolase family 28 protein [Edaphobacter aggregans]RSL18524.1 Ig-like domain-containing protein [Edaphobacter aggregans]